MSYILEAMRRAEADRHRGEVPLLNESSAAAAEASRAEPTTSRLGLLWSAAIGLTIGFAGYALLRHFVFGTPPPPPVPVVAGPAAGVGAGGTLPPQAWGGNGQVGGGGAGREASVSRPVSPDTKVGDAPAPASPTRDQRAPATGSSDGKAAPTSTKPKSPGESESSSRTKPPSTGAAPRAESRGVVDASPGTGSRQAKAEGSGSAPSRRPVSAAPEPAAPSASPRQDALAGSPTAVPPPAAVATPAPPAALPRVRDLPAELQRDVPPLLVSGWVQSADPGSRQLLVNGVLLREGDALTPVLRLEMIGRRTAVFSVRGQRFEVPISL
jgi:general secretion pathway protein B